MTDNAAFWDKIAPKYAKDPISDMAAYEYTLERTQSYLRDTDNVLELGCGTGSTALQLAPYAGHITATDLSPGMIDIANAKTKPANVTFAVADNAPSTGAFDVVMAHNLFHLVDDMETLFAQINALLPKGGYFISKSPCLAQKGGGLKGALMRGVILVAIPLLGLLGKAPPVRRFSIDQLETAITSAGFEIIESSNHPVGPPPARYIVARKL